MTFHPRGRDGRRRCTCDAARDERGPSGGGDTRESVCCGDGDEHNAATLCGEEDEGGAACDGRGAIFSRVAYRIYNYITLLVPGTVNTV